MSDWKIFQGSQDSAKQKLAQLLAVKAPSWRQFVDAEQADDWDTQADEQYWQTLIGIAEKKTRDNQRGDRFCLRIAEPMTAEKNPYDEVIEAVNAALYLRRPLMITGRPGSGKTSLAYALARELNLGPVLLWPITTRSSLVKDGLYEYDAIARLQDAQLSEQLHKLSIAEAEQSINADSGAGARTQSENILERVASSFKDIGQYIRLGPVGTAFLPSERPRVLLIDEIDKSDINLPNELLNLFEEGEFEIPELKRLSKAGTHSQQVESDDGIVVPVSRGNVRCRAFPIIIMTSNGERDFPPAFYRRCLRVSMPQPSEAALKVIVKEHLGKTNVEQFTQVIESFASAQNSENSERLPTDALLNLIYLFAQGSKLGAQNIDKATLKKLLFNPSSDAGEMDA